MGLACLAKERDTIHCDTGGLFKAKGSMKMAFLWEADRGILEEGTCDLDIHR